MSSDEIALEIKDLKTHFIVDGQRIPAVDGVSYNLKKGKTLGVVGESGCGKSVTAFSIMRLVPTPPGRYEGGEILFEGRDILKMSDDELRQLRGNKIAMIFQEPMTSLNPVYTVGNQIMEAILLHTDLNKEQARERAIEMLDKVGIPAPAERIDDYPHQMSGGMKQRVMIAMALCCNPEVLIADEPTTALDVTIQAQILDLISGLRQSEGMGVILITHDLGVVAETCDDVVVMYASKVVEMGSCRDIFKNPQHPYTVGLLKSLPRLDQKVNRLDTIEGAVPKPTDYPPGCHFYGRCQKRLKHCKDHKPELNGSGDGHHVACWLYEEVPQEADPIPQGAVS